MNKLLLLLCLISFSSCFTPFKFTKEDKAQRKINKAFKKIEKLQKEYPNKFDVKTKIDTVLTVRVDTILIDSISIDSVYIRSLETVFDTLKIVKNGINTTVYVDRFKDVVKYKVITKIDSLRVPIIQRDTLIINKTLIQNTRNGNFYETFFYYLCVFVGVLILFLFMRKRVFS